VAKRLSLQPISDEILISRLNICFNLIIIRLYELNSLDILIGYNNLETLVIKSFTFCGINETKLEHSV
jgi:hypothetical protein